MSAVNVWDGTQWQLMDDKGPVGDQGPVGDKGPSTRISNCCAFTVTLVGVPDGGYEPTGLAAIPELQGVQPCMVLSGTKRLKAVKAGVHLITLRVDLSVNAPSSPDNWFIIERTVAVGGETRIGSGDIAYGGFGETQTTLSWLGIGEEIYFYFAKTTYGNHNIVFTVEAVMMQ